jgi:predicted metal-dependent HD superfamily phosphohydrolase
MDSQELNERKEYNCLYGEKLKELYDSVELLAPINPYHNNYHLIDVATSCRRYAQLEGQNYHQTFILEIAGLLHDVIYEQDDALNERKSAEFAYNLLYRKGYSINEIKEVGRLILATKMPTDPQDILEKIICDADLDCLGRDDFFSKTELLRLEKHVDKAIWYCEILPEFLTQVQYYTESARQMRKEKLKENLEKLVDGCYGR